MGAILGLGLRRQRGVHTTGAFEIGETRTKPFFERRMPRYVMIRHSTKMALQRWSFRGSTDRWIESWASGSEGKHSDPVKRFCPHIGQESCFELMWVETGMRSLGLR